MNFQFIRVFYNNPSDAPEINKEILHYISLIMSDTVVHSPFKGASR